MGKSHKPGSKGENGDQEPSVEGMRLNKYVAHCGVCSRRQAAAHVKAGLVKVNGAVVDNPAYQVQPGDRIAFRGKPIRPEEKRVYFLMNKPKDIITTVKDERGRRTVIDLLKNKVEERIFPVGRLDRNTTGLLLLTNDGELAKKLSHPSHKVPKVYYITLDKPVPRTDIDAIARGVELEDGVVPISWVRHVEERDRTVVGLEIHVGRNRIVRRLFEHLGYQVRKLDRVYYAGLTKKDLPRGFWRPLTEKEVLMLRHFV